jgi:hypothetical protein
METTMRNLVYVACIVALCAAVFGLSALVSAPATSAQQPKFEAPRQGYADVEAAARKLLAAYATGDAEKLWESLAAPRRNSCALALARSIRRYEEKPESFEKFKTRMPKLDPAGKLKMKTLDDLRAMRPADFFALTTGMLVASATENVRARLKGQWYMVEREIGLTQLRELRGAAEIVTRGYVCFENLEGDLIKVGCMPDDDGWRMTTFDVKVGDFHRGFTGTFALGGVQGQMGDAEMSEARAALGAMKDRARVVYQRSMRAPEDLDDLGIGENELEGSYFDASCYKITDSNERNWTAICKPKNADGPVLAVVCNLVEGRSQFSQYEDEEEMKLNPPKLEEKK